MDKHIKSLLLIVAFFAALSSNAFATDYPNERDLEILFIECNWILIAEFKGYELGNQVSVNNPPTATYKIIEILKGAKSGNSLRIRHDLDLTQNEEKSFSFTPSMMPPAGSKWILFIPSAIPQDGVIRTYEGPKGRIKYSKEQLERLVPIIERRKTTKAYPSRQAKTKSDRKRTFYNPEDVPVLKGPRENLKLFLEGKLDSYSGVDSYRHYEIFHYPPIQRKKR